MTWRKLGKVRVKYERQWNLYNNLLRKTKQKYFCNLNTKDLNDSKKFWKKIKPFFSYNGLQTNNIILKDKNRFLTDSSIIANAFNNYFFNNSNTLDFKLSMRKSKSSLHKKWSFPLRISSVNVTKSTENSGFGHIYWRNLLENFIISAVHCPVY